MFANLFYGLRIYLLFTYDQGRIQGGRGWISKIYGSQGVFRRYLVSSGKKEKVDPFPRKKILHM